MWVGFCVTCFEKDCIYHWNGNSWDKVSGLLSHIDVSPNGHVIGVNMGMVIYHSLHSKKGEWSKLDGLLVHVAAGNDTAYGINKDDAVYRGDYAGHWVLLPIKLTSISCSADGKTVWGTNRAGNVFRLVGDQWQQVDGALQQVSVSQDGKYVVGTNAGCDVFRRRTDLPSVWEKLPGALSWVSTFDGSILAGVNSGMQPFFAGF